MLFRLVALLPGNQMMLGMLSIRESKDIGEQVNRLNSKRDCWP